MSPKTTPGLEVDEPSMNGQEPPEPTQEQEQEPAQEQDPFDPELHIVSQDARTTTRERHAFRLRKPKKEEFIRVHPGPEYCKDLLLLEVEDGMDKLRYLVLQQYRALIPAHIGMKQTRLFLAVNLDKVPFFWPINVPVGSNTGGGNDWSESAISCANEAKSEWLQVAANKSEGFYETFRPDDPDELGEPEWPNKSFRDLTELAFKGNVVDRPNHPVIEKLRKGKVTG
jgi:hypothetical protein